MEKEVIKNNSNYTADRKAYEDYWIGRIRKIQEKHMASIGSIYSSPYDTLDAKKEEPQVQNDDDIVSSSSYVDFKRRSLNYYINSSINGMRCEFSNFNVDSNNDSYILSLYRYTLIHLKEIVILIDDVINCSGENKGYISHRTKYLSKMYDNSDENGYKCTNREYNRIKNIFCDIDADLIGIYITKDLSEEIDAKKALYLDEQMYLLHSSMPHFTSTPYLTIFNIYRKCDFLYWFICDVDNLRETLIEIKFGKTTEKFDSKLLLSFVPDLISYIDKLEKSLKQNQKKRV